MCRRGSSVRMKPRFVQVFLLCRDLEAAEAAAADIREDTQGQVSRDIQEITVKKISFLNIFIK